MASPSTISSTKVSSYLNSTVGLLICEIFGRKNLDGGMVKAEASDLKSYYCSY